MAKHIGDDNNNLLWIGLLGLGAWWLYQSWTSGKFGIPNKLALPGPGGPNNITGGSGNVDQGGAPANNQTKPSGNTAAQQAPGAPVYQAPKLNMGVPSITSGQMYSAPGTVTDKNNGISLTVGADPNTGGNAVYLSQLDLPTGTQQVYSYVGTQVYDLNGILQYTSDAQGKPWAFLGIEPSTNMIVVNYGDDFTSGFVGYVEPTSVYVISNISETN